jgi:hypothetical protein
VQVDFTRGLAGNSTNGPDPASFDGHVFKPCRVPGSINHPAIPQDEIVLSGPEMGGQPDNDCYPRDGGDHGANLKPLFAGGKGKAVVESGKRKGSRGLRMEDSG